MVILIFRGFSAVVNFVSVLDIIVASKLDIILFVFLRGSNLDDSNDVIIQPTTKTVGLRF